MTTDTRLACELRATADAVRQARTMMNRQLLYGDLPPALVPHATTVLVLGLDLAASLDALAVKLAGDNP